MHMRCDQKLLNSSSKFQLISKKNSLELGFGDNEGGVSCANLLLGEFFLVLLLKERPAVVVESSLSRFGEILPGELGDMGALSLLLPDMTRFLAAAAASAAMFTGGPPDSVAGSSSWVESDSESVVSVRSLVNEPSSFLRAAAAASAVIVTNSVGIDHIEHRGERRTTRCHQF